MEKILSSLAVISALLRSETGYAVVRRQTFSGLSFVCIHQRSKLVLLREISWTSFDLFDSMPIHLLHSFPTEVSRENLPRRVRRARRSRTRGPMRIEIYFCEGWEWSSRIRWLPPCSLGRDLLSPSFYVGALYTAWPSWIWYQLILATF